MNEKKLKKLNDAKVRFDESYFDYYEYENGHLQVDGVDYWATTGKWYDNKYTKGGKGLEEFIEYILSKYHKN